MDAPARARILATMDQQGLPQQVRQALARWENEGGALPAAAVLAARALGFDVPDNADSAAAPLPHARPAVAASHGIAGAAAPVPILEGALR
jgi:hypothetical protein